MIKTTKIKFIPIVMYPKDADRVANSVNTNQTGSGTVLYGSTLLAQTCLSEYVGSLRYSDNLIIAL